MSGCDVTEREAKMADEYVNFTVVNALPKAITLDEVEQATLKDNVQVVKAVSDGHWRSIQKSADTRLRSFYNLRHELSRSKCENCYARFLYCHSCNNARTCGCSGT